MGAMKREFTEIQGEMYAVAEALHRAAMDADFEEMMQTLIGCTAKLAVVTRRYHEIHE